MQNILILNLPKIRQISLKWKINLKTIWILSFILITLLLVFYIIQLNMLFLETNLIKNYEKKLNDITKENKILEISSVQVNSLGDIDSQIAEKFNEFGFEKVKDVHYINVLENMVAKVNKKNE